MRKLLFWTIPATLALLSGCVVAPIGPPRGYYGGPHIAVFAPGPVFYGRGYYRSRW
jgi:hypothetical protein